MIDEKSLEKKIKKHPEKLIYINKNKHKCRAFAFFECKLLRKFQQETLFKFQDKIENICFIHLSTFYKLKFATILYKIHNKFAFPPKNSNALSPIRMEGVRVAKILNKALACEWSIKLDFMPTMQSEIDFYDFERKEFLAIKEFLKLHNSRIILPTTCSLDEYYYEHTRISDK